MAKKPPASTPKAAPMSVDDFMDALRHPLKPEAQALRAIIQKAGRTLTEDIKWNAPNYAHNGHDRITLNLSAKDKVRIIFHRGATDKHPKGAKRPIDIDADFLTWPSPDRAIATFTSLEDIKANQAAITRLVKAWLAAA